MFLFTIGTNIEIGSPILLKPDLDDLVLGLRLGISNSGQLFDIGLAHLLIRFPAR